MLTDLSGRRFGVLGLGRSGIGAARLIVRLGGTALLSDLKTNEHLIAKTATLHGPGLDIELGGHNRLLNEKFDAVIVSPGAVMKDEWLQAWQSSSTPLWSELELASRCYSGKWVGITGSNGKTTTVTLLTSMLRRGGLRAVSVGNIGTAWSEVLPAQDVDVFVVEVSSFQMELTHSAAPSVCVLLNVLENHLDRHGDIETYGKLKLKLAAHQNPHDVVVLNGDDSFLRSRAATLPGRAAQFGCDGSFAWSVRDQRLHHLRDGHDDIVLDSSEWKLEGRHNLLNAAAAASAAEALGVADADIRSALLVAEPVEHRIEFVRELDGVRFINDSKSTNLTATLTAIEAVHGSIILLFGGRAKKESFAPLAQLLGNRLHSMIAFGECRPKVREDVGERDTVHFVESLVEAVAMAKSLSTRGQVVLLSPGCASYDQFSNYEERGTRFKEFVMSL